MSNVRNDNLLNRRFIRSNFSAFAFHPACGEQPPYTCYASQSSKTKAARGTNVHCCNRSCRGRRQQSAQPHRRRPGADRGKWARCCAPSTVDPGQSLSSHSSLIPPAAPWTRGHPVRPPCIRRCPPAASRLLRAAFIARPRDQTRGLRCCPFVAALTASEAHQVVVTVVVVVVRVDRMLAQRLRRIIKRVGHSSADSRRIAGGWRGRGGRAGDGGGRSGCGGR
jgi:hypothetical protein